ncbi:hypothetical protein GCM10027200_09100 [Lentzea nigeriaca]
MLDEYDELLRDTSWHMSRVVITEDDGRVSLRVEATSTESERVALCFDGVVELAFRQESGFPLDLQIIDMGDAGWEGVTFKVTDPEHGIASFWCAEFRIEVGNPDE